METKSPVESNIERNWGAVVMGLVTLRAAVGLQNLLNEIDHDDYSIEEVESFVDYMNPPINLPEDVSEAAGELLKSEGGHLNLFNKLFIVSETFNVPFGYRHSGIATEPNSFDVVVGLIDKLNKVLEDPKSLNHSIYEKLINDITAISDRAANF